jgi:hypothetical protein
MEELMESRRTVGQYGQTLTLGLGPALNRGVSEPHTVDVARRANERRVDRSRTPLDRQR